MSVRVPNRVLGLVWTQANREIV